MEHTVIQILREALQAIKSKTGLMLNEKTMNYDPVSNHLRVSIFVGQSEFVFHDIESHLAQYLTTAGISYDSLSMSLDPGQNECWINLALCSPTNQGTQTPDPTSPNEQKKHSCIGLCCRVTWLGIFFTGFLSSVVYLLFKQGIIHPPPY
jgi:hypothetical protein